MAVVSDYKLALWRTAVLNLDLGIIIGDVTGRVLERNDVLECLQGVEPARAREFVELSEPGGPPLPAEQWPMARVCRGEVVRNLELETRRSDLGRSWCVSYTGSVVPSPDGGPDLVVLSMRDVTAERRARQSHLLLEAVTEGMTDPVFVKDCAGRFLLANDAVCRLNGFQREELLGRTDADLFEPDSAAHVRERDLHIIRTGLTETEEETLTTHEGVQRTFLTTKAPYRNRAGEILGVLGIARDITALLESQRHLRELADAMPQVVWTTRPDGSVEYVNQRGLATFGKHDPEDPLAIVHPEDRERLVQRMQTTLREGQPFSCEHRLRTQEGHYRWFLHRQAPGYDAHGDVVRWYCTATDITEHKELEAQFAQAQKMEAVGRLAGGVAHDFNNLLTVIQGYCSLLLETLEPDSPHREAVSAIHDAGARSARLTRQLLSFSRQDRCDPRVLDLNTVLRDCQKLLRRLIGEDVAMQLELDPDLPPLLADPGQLEQLIMNLAVNARDALPHGGTFQVRTRRRGDELELYVSDNGTGMTPEVLDKIFDPFYTTKPVGRGTGLGLSVVHGVVKRMGGSVCVQSAPGTGTAFTFLFPATREAVAPSVPAASKSSNGCSGTILLVEDDRAVRRLVTLALRKHGYRVLEAGSGREALERIGEPFDMLLSDVVMPEMNGAQLAEAMEAQRPGLPVLLMTGYAPEDLLERGVGNRDLLAKPFTPAVLVERVNRALSFQGQGR